VSNARAALPIYCDGIKEVEIRDGLVHLGFFVKRGGGKRVHVRVSLPPTGLVSASQRINADLQKLWRSFDA
jgi:hypothetical protein